MSKRIEMRRLAIQLLRDISGDLLLDEMDNNYIKICMMTKRIPKVEINVETEYNKIKNQYIQICKSIYEKLKKQRKSLIVITMFAATEQLMIVYNKVDRHIIKLHAMWFSDVLDELNVDIPDNSEMSNNFIYFGIFSLCIVFILNRLL